MGLDMNFYARKSEYITPGSCPDKRKGEYPPELKPLVDEGYGVVVFSTTYDIGYFRKFNALHSYIVEHFADGDDSCQEIHLSREDIESMSSVMKAVIADHSKAPELLPTSEGFFFGSTDYDNSYYDDVLGASTLFEKMLANIDFTEYAVIYQASW